MERRGRSQPRGDRRAPRVWKPEEEANLTKEEREQRFRFQIQSPVTLTTFIKRSQSMEEFMWTLTTAMDETMLNHIHITAAFTKLAALKKQAPLAEKHRRSPSLATLAQS